VIINHDLHYHSDRRLILPPYPTKEMLRSKLHIALEYGAAGYDRM
jgi:hypothetical protein